MRKDNRRYGKGAIPAMQFPLICKHALPRWKEHFAGSISERHTRKDESFSVRLFHYPEGAEKTISM